MFLVFAQQPNGHFQSMQVASDNYAATVTAACLLRLEFPVAKESNTPPLFSNCQTLSKE